MPTYDHQIATTDQLGLKFEEGIRFLVKKLPISTPSSRKPVLFHNVRVGVYLYHHAYPQEVVLAGLLHDTLEWSSTSINEIRDAFGENITKLVIANTKDDTIKGNKQKTRELIQRCAENGQDALIVKTADIIDSFRWYESQNNLAEIGYCLQNATAILEYKKSYFNDPIFSELSSLKQRLEPKNN